MNRKTNTRLTPELLLHHGYRYIKLIGEGSNGKTYLSKSLKTGETVAIKALKFSDSLKNYELFKREAETLKSLHTPGTPRFYDYITGEGEFSECWLVQEYIEGESLLNKLNKGEKFDEIQSLELIFETAKIVHTLQTSYAPPIIHRDIKPSNILMHNAQAGNTRLCLIDFGAVANPQKRGLNSTVAGTVGYMAPEQLIGDCTIQSDYYALGATALHLITGINPSEFPTDGFTLQFEEKLKQCTPGVHKETVDLLHKLLAPNANERPKDAQDLLKSISQVLISINSAALIPVIKKRKNLEKKKQRLEKKIHFNHSNLSIFLAVVITGSLPIAIFADITPLIIICLFTFILFSIFCFINPLLVSPEKRLEQVNAALMELPDYNLQKTEIQKYSVVEKTPDLSDSKEAAGEIVRVIDNIIEYIVNIEHEYYTVFYQNDKQHPYQIGDKVRVKYVKKLGKYRFFEVRPENTHMTHKSRVI